MGPSQSSQSLPLLHKGFRQANDSGACSSRRNGGVENMDFSARHVLAVGLRASEGK